MGERRRVALLFGGRSAEHEVSVRSARNVFQSIDPKNYEVLLIGIDKAGRWVHIDDPDILLSKDTVRYRPEEEVVLLPFAGNRKLMRLKDQTWFGPVDIFFPVLHGSFGEDGTIQGLLKICEVPFVGAGLLGSAVGMDKDVMKRLLRDAGIPIPRFFVFLWKDKERIDFSGLKEELGVPLFVKPANLGSSVGISKVIEKNEFYSAVLSAFQYDTKIIVEEYIEGREIECSVLGNEEPFASVPGEIIPAHEFYSYEAKYIDESGARLKVPALLSEKQTRRIRELALRSFKVLECEGMARIDFFVRKEEVFVNEINTIPGFTDISMYPKLWEASGISTRKLVERLIELGFERHEREKRLKRTL